VKKKILFDVYEQFIQTLTEEFINFFTFTARWSIQWDSHQSLSSKVNIKY